MSETKPHSQRGYLGVLVFVVVLAGMLWAAFNRQYVIDQVKVLQYTPSQQILTIREDLDLTSSGAFMFDASQPVLQKAEAFNESCQQKTETNNPIIGCYTANLIYIYDVTRPELDGIEETTAAHELLHAVYQRLNAGEKNRIDTELQKAYERVKTPELEKRMSYYEKTEPGQENDELHSILGTEYLNLGDELESHYAKYFMSRKKIISYHEAYSSTFDKITEQITSLEEKINDDVKSINNRVSRYNAASAQLSDDTESFNSKSQSGGFSTQAEFDQQRQLLVDRKETLDSEYAAITDAIATVKDERARYNQLVDTYNQLSKSLNSSLDSAPKAPKQAP